MDLITGGGQAFRGELSVPGDKSISHRAVILGSLAQGETTISGFLPSADCLATVDCMRSLGVAIHLSADRVRVAGCGLKLPGAPRGALFAANSGTTARLLLGVLAGQPFSATITGDDSLSRRPMERVMQPLSLMGARFSDSGSGRLPLTVTGGRLQPITYRLPVASAQVKSAILLAGLQAGGWTVVEEPLPTRDHTERLLRYLGAGVRQRQHKVFVRGGGPLHGREIRVPGDLSSAAFFIAAAALDPHARLLLKGVGINPTRTGILDVLANMGADIAVLNKRRICGEPVGDILVRGQARLRGITVDGAMIPRIIDEIPVLAVVAALADGQTIITGAQELRVKETDRLRALAGELTRMGARIVELPDGLVIEGVARLTGAVCRSHGDHRIAMALAVAAAFARGWTCIRDAECIAISFPGFIPLWRRFCPER